MIKVLHIGHSRKWRGGENQVRLLIQGMKSQNYQVQHYIAYPGGAQMIERLGGEVSGVLRLPSSQPTDPRAIMALREFTRLQGIDILDAHSGSAHSLAYYAKFCLPDIKLVVHRRVNFPIKTLYFTRKKYLSRKIDHYVAISSAIGDSLAGYGIPRNKISLIKSTVDQRPYQGHSKPEVKNKWCQRYGLDSVQPLLGFAGALDASKDPVLFVRMIQLLRQRGHPVSGLIAGSGDQQGRLDSEIRESGLQQQIKLTGFVGDMPGLLAALDMFVLPSKQEGLGTVLLEAILSGCLVIASDVGGIGEIIRHRETGMLSQPGDVGGFVDAAETLLDNPELSARLRQNATGHVRDSFNLANLLQQHYRLYEKLVSRSGDDPV